MRWKFNFFRARPKYFLLKNTIGHQEIELCYIQYPPSIEFLWICRDPLMILTKFALFWNISHEVDVPRQGQIKISQLDNKTSLDLAISRIRTWGASSTTFFLELGEKYFSVVFELQKQSCQYLCVIDRLMSIMLYIRQSVSSWRGETWNDSQGWEILKMKKNKSKQIKQNPNDLRLMVRETTSTRRPPGSSSSGSSRPPRAPQDAVEEEQYYDQDNAGVTFLKIDFLANFLLSIILWWIICCATSFIVRVNERGLGSTQYSQQFWAYTFYNMLCTMHYTKSPLCLMIGELNLFVFGDSIV